jgi:hypothetical protein
MGKYKNLKTPDTIVLYRDRFGVTLWGTGRITVEDRLVERTICTIPRTVGDENTREEWAHFITNLLNSEQMKQDFGN